MKTCTKCGVVKSLEDFTRESKTKDGLRGHCKACRNADNATYRAANLCKVKARAAAYSAANRDKRREYSAAYRAINKDKLNAKTAEWTAANPERKKTTSAAYRAAFPERIRASNAAWTKANPESRRSIRQNYNARKRADGGKLTRCLVERLFKLQKGKCVCCGKMLGVNFHRDHVMPVALEGANEDWNIQLLCAPCNLSKGKKHPVDFMQSRGFLL